MVKVAGRNRHIQRLRATKDAARQADAGVYLAAEIIRAEAQHLIVQGSISGAGHIPSAPGEPPNADTRALDTSIVAVKKGPGRANVEAGGGGVNYAAYLEFGTSKMAARPYMRPAVQNSKGRIFRDIGAKISARIRRG